MHAIVRWAAATLALSLAAPTPIRAASCSPPLRPRIAEILYDALGDDAQREFVELHNPSGERRSLAGVVLEVGDGSGPGRWTARWTGAAGDSVAPFGRTGSCTRYQAARQLASTTRARTEKSVG